MNAKNVLCYLAVTTLIAALGPHPTHAAPSGPQNLTPQEVFDGMKESFQAEKAKGVNARYQWDLSGPDGGQWWIEVQDGKCKMARGRIDNPNVTFVLRDRDWVGLSNGTLPGFWAYMTGRLKIRGDRELAKKLGQMFP